MRNVRTCKGSTEVLTMVDRSLRRIALVAAMLMIAACGGTTTPTQNGGGGGGGTDGPAATEPSATQAPVATQTGGGGGGGDGFNGGPCSLLTADEVQGVLGESGWTTQEFPIQNGSGQCLYTTADSSSIAALSVTTGQFMQLTWDAYANDADDAAPVAGIGDKAIFSKSNESLFFLKGNTLIGITAGLGSDGYDLRLEHSKAMGVIVAGRL